MHHGNTISNYSTTQDRQWDLEPARRGRVGILGVVRPGCRLRRIIRLLAYADVLRHPQPAYTPFWDTSRDVLGELGIWEAVSVSYNWFRSTASRFLDLPL